jgi:dTDP-4-amino-4,6-dideoxygalactose transaminase
MMAKGVGPGDAILCPAFTYTATPESIALLGATPIFVDVGADTFNIVDGAKVEAGIATARHRKLRPVGVIVVDLFGLPACRQTIGKFARLSSVSDYGS